MNEMTIPGPANFAAAIPVRTKMPAPMMAPMPSDVRLTGPSTRLRRWSVSASACKSATRRRANKFMRGESYWIGGHRQASFPPKAPVPAAGTVHIQKLEDIELRKRLTV